MEGTTYLVPMDQISPISPFVRKLQQLRPGEIYGRNHKKMKVNNDDNDDTSISLVPGSQFESKYKARKSLPDVLDYSDPFSVPNLMEELERSIYGSVTKEIKDLVARKNKLLKNGSAMSASLATRRLDLSFESTKCCLGTGQLNAQSTKASQLDASQNIVGPDDDCVVIGCPEVKSSAEETQKFGSHSIQPIIGRQMKISDLQNDIKSDRDQVVIIDSDEEDVGCQSIQPVIVVSATQANWQASYKYQEVVLKKAVAENRIKEYADKNQLDIVQEEQKSFIAEKERKGKDVFGSIQEEQKSPITENERIKDKGIYVGVRDEMASDISNLQSDPEDGLGDMWREMALAMEFSKDAAGEEASVSSEEEGEDCDHSFVLKDDLGYVCRVCGVIEKSIETIFEYQWSKGPKTTRTYMYESRNIKDREQNDATSLSPLDSFQQNLAVAEVSVHPRHMKQMKPHQLEGFNFLVRNLVSDEPSGCILAHAPGSGKTFMIISFLQSFLAKCPNARPLVVLPKGILGTWKREFEKWQIEDLPLYDFYSYKAEKRSDQLDILKQWMEHKSILFLGYKQFSNIVCGSASSTIAADCHDLLLNVPTLLILDEGHTPRNEDTNVLSSLAQVKTRRKVVLSGTLFQNHVKEVFNILNLVCPKFLRMDTCKAIKKRIMSRVQMSACRRQPKANGGDALFYEVVEETLQHDEDFKRKVTVIKDLREMTRSILHYYKGDFLEELPGIVDFTVLLNLSPKQKHEMEKLKKMEKFKRHSKGTVVYLHPLLKEFSDTALLVDKGCIFDENKMEDLLNKMDIRDGVKVKFFLNILGLCELSREKLLVFSQYLLPLKFLEKLVVKSRGWSLGKEIFMISGDSSPEHRELSMERFNNSPDARVFFGSIRACGEGISLVGASRVLLLDVHLNPSVSRQGIGRAFRPGQVKKVYIYRLVAADSPEEENHNICFRKELISKMWFEWSEYSGNKDFEMESVDPKDTDDMFWESPSLGEDVKVLYRR